MEQEKKYDWKPVLKDLLKVVIGAIMGWLGTS